MTFENTIKGIINTTYLGIGDKDQTEHKVTLIKQAIRSEITAAMPEKKEHLWNCYFVTDEYKDKEDLLCSCTAYHVNHAIDETRANLLQRFGAEGQQEKVATEIEK